MYEIIVGNIGLVCKTSIYEDAYNCYLDYKYQSSDGRGRAYGEDVTLLHNGEIIQEYIGAINRE